MHQVLVFTAADGKWQRYMETDSRDYSYDRMYVEELDHFLQAVRGEAVYMHTFRDVRRMMETLQAVETSAVEGRRVLV